MKTLYKPENEAEAIAIQNLLADNGIFCTIHTFNDTAYAGLYQNQYGWGVIKVSESDLIEASRIIESWRFSAPDVSNTYCTDYKNNINNANSRLRITTLFTLTSPLLLIISIIFNIYFVWLFHFKNSSLEPKYNEYDASNFLMAKVDWKNNTHSPYEYLSYDKSGNLLSMSYDTNNDGRTNYFVRISVNSKIEYFDSNHNSIFEKSVETFDNGSTITSLDEDENSVYENVIIKINNNEKLLFYFLTQNNRNGLIEKIIDTKGKVVDLNILKELAEKI